MYELQLNVVHSLLRPTLATTAVIYIILKAPLVSLPYKQHNLFTNIFGLCVNLFWC